MREIELYRTETLRSVSYHHSVTLPLPLPGTPSVIVRRSHLAYSLTNMQNRTDTLEIGSPAPDFSPERLRAQTVSLSTLCQQWE